MGYVIGILLVMVGFYLLVSGIGTNTTLALTMGLGGAIFFLTAGWNWDD